MRSGIQCASAQARAPPSGARGALAGDARGGAVVLGVRPSHRRSGAARRPTFQASPREPHRESPSLREPQPADFVECTDAHLAIAAACAGRRGVPGASERPRACSQRRRSESPSVRAPSPESPKSREPSGLSRRGALTRAQGSQGGALVTPAALVVGEADGRCCRRHAKQLAYLVQTCRFRSTDMHMYMLYMYMCMYMHMHMYMYM